MSRRPVIGVCWKLVDLRAAVDPLTGEVLTGASVLGSSPADEAALEWALRVAESWGGSVVVVAAGDRSCEPMLASALAAGAAHAVRVDLDPEAPSAVVAAGLASVLREAEVAGVMCGDASLDRGSGSVPAYLAGELRAAQALGLVALALEPGAETLLVDRRLDRGRRERLRLREPFVLSLEASTARLRRASLPAVLARRDADVDVVSPVGQRIADVISPAGQRIAEAVSPAGQRIAEAVRIVRIEPFRPRARVVPPPAALGPRERILALTGALREQQPPRTLTLPPDQAAAAILQALSDWGELP